MNHFFNKTFVLVNAIIVISIGIIIFSILQIELDASISSLFPANKKLERTIYLSSHSPVSDKIMVFAEIANSGNLEEIVSDINSVVDQAPLTFNNVIPTQDDITQIMSYYQENALLLYPYEKKENPFSQSQLETRLVAKGNFLISLPFFAPDQSFFLDPLMMGPELFNDINNQAQGKFSPFYGGIVSPDKKAYLRILKTDFHSERYDRIKDLITLNKQISEIGEKHNIQAFLYSAHLYFWESKNTITFDVSIIFILNILLILLIFYYFFKDLKILIINFMPIVAGFALVFLGIAIFKKTFGGIALAFGAATAGIAIDYNIHYLTKIHYYNSLTEIRSKIGSSLILGFATTIISFIFLPFSKIVSLQEIAFFGIVGITIIFLCSWFGLQNIVKPKRKPASIPPPKILFNTGTKSFVAWCLLTVILLAGTFFISFEDQLLNLDMKHTKLKQHLKYIQNHFLESSDSLFLTFEGDNTQDCLDKSFYALQAVKKKDSTLGFLTPALYRPPENLLKKRTNTIRSTFNKTLFDMELEKSIFVPESFEEFSQKIHNINNEELSELPGFLQREIDSMITIWQDKHYLMIPLHNRKFAYKLDSILKIGNYDYFITDFLTDSGQGLMSFEKNALLLLSLSIIIIFLIILIFYRNILYAFTAVLPCITALMTCIFMSVILPGGYNIMHFVSSILLLGIGVDYGIFITSAYKNKSSQKELSLTYRAIIISALTTIASFGILIISRNKSIFSLGISMFTGIISAYITSFIALPYILNKKNRKNQESAVKS